MTAYVQGWSRQPVDVCYLDCPMPGYLLQVGDSHICLCASHARVLEGGKYRNSYRGAPLPLRTKATSWPWQDWPVELDPAA